MNILWHSNGPDVPSGYGTQTRIWTKMLKDNGYHVDISSFFGQEGYTSINSDGIVVYPRASEPWGNDIIVARATDTKADIVISLIDTFVLQPQQWSKINWVAWSPIDSSPILPENGYALQSAKYIWSMSEFGHQELLKAGFTNVTLVPHGINTSTFIPMDRKIAREWFSDKFKKDVSNKFIVMCNAANKGKPGRKNIPLMLEAFSIFLKDHPDSLFYCHSEPMGIYQGENLPLCAEALGIKDKVIFPSQYYLVTGLYSEEQLNYIYNAADVLMNLARGEGYGLTIVESQAAGCPVIVSNFSSMIELGQEGILVDGILYPFVAPTYQFIPSLQSAVTALNSAYDEYQRDNGENWRTSARIFALQYDKKIIWDKYMHPALIKIEQDLLRQKQEEEIIVVNSKDNQ